MEYLFETEHLKIRKFVIEDAQVDFYVNRGSHSHYKWHRPLEED